MKRKIIELEVSPQGFYFKTLIYYNHDLYQITELLNTRPQKRIKMTKKRNNEHIEMINDNRSLEEIIEQIPTEKIEIKDATPTQKGDWLEETTRRILELLQFEVQISKSRKWKKKKNDQWQLQILGDYGIDLHARTLDHETGKEFKLKIQCKCYKNNDSISTDIPSALKGIISDDPSYIGLLVTLNNESLNERACNIIRNSKVRILQTQITDLPYILEKLRNLPEYDHNRRIITCKKASKISIKGIEMENVEDFEYEF